MIVWIQFALIALLFALSAFFAGTETGVYRLSRLWLRIGTEQQKRTFVLLSKLLKDGQGLILSVLVGNNMVNYGLTSLVTVMLLKRFQDSHTAEIYATVILTPTLFIFGEIVPKILYYHKANTFMPALAPATWLAHRVFTYSGIVPVLKGISALLSRLFRSQVNTAAAVDAAQRHQVRQIINETQEEGLLTEPQKEMMERLVDLGAVSIGSVMVPLKKVEMVPAPISNKDLLAHLHQTTHTRQLVYDGNRQNITGYINIYETLSLSASISETIKKLPAIDRRKTVLEAIDILRNHRCSLALVTEQARPHSKPVGIVAITDLVEELTGELTA
ncbi:MAG: CNNM domain-containing protein [Planctomycetota bacterium]|jgi:CBS domain containing-hemolysin-like protein